MFDRLLEAYRRSLVRALRHQGLGERQRFRTGLAPCDPIAGFDESAEFQGLELEQSHRDSDPPY